MIAFLDAFLASYFIGAAVLFSAKQYALLQRDGDGRAHHGPLFSAQWFGRASFDVLRIVILAIVASRLIWPGIDAWLLPVPVLWESAAVRCIGAALMLFGLWRSFHAHSYMGDHWRSGVLDGTVGPLITGGPFARCRNPIFTGVIIAQIGFLLALPSGFSALCLIAGVIALLNQSRVEEAHLTTRFGVDYQTYRAKTPRWRL